MEILNLHVLKSIVSGLYFERNCGVQDVTEIEVPFNTAAISKCLTNTCENA